MNEFEYQMLDALLEAFGDRNTLTRDQVLQLFDSDERLAAEAADVLVAEGLVGVNGMVKEGLLPATLHKLPKAQEFLEQGGFAGRVHKLSPPSRPDWNEEQLRKRNTELQNETLRLQRLIRDQQAEITAFDEKLKVLKLYKFAIYLCCIVIAALLTWIFLGHAMGHHH